jgi:endogenous inhibitor of DNA gyrase (YacG/DUF329 family)
MLPYSACSTREGRYSLVGTYKGEHAMRREIPHDKVTRMRERVCPICGVKLRDQDAHSAFCSERCRLIDLGNWLGEAYRVPDDSSAPDDPSEEWPS